MRWAVFIRTSRDLDNLAEQLRTLLNVGSVNPTSYQRDQRRESMNMGGTYYLFEVIGLELLLLRNSGEALIEEREDFSFYLAVRRGMDHVGEQVATHLAEQISSVGMVAIAAEVE